MDGAHLGKWPPIASQSVDGLIAKYVPIGSMTIYSYADDTTLHFSTSYNRRPTQQELNDSRRDAIGRLTSDLSLAYDWGRAKLFLFIASKTQFLQLSTRHNLPDNYPLFVNDTQLSFSAHVWSMALMSGVLNSYSFTKQGGV